MDCAQTARRLRQRWRLLDRLGLDSLTPTLDRTMIDLSRIRDDLLALALFAATVFVGLALFSYHPADPPGTSVFPPAESTANLCGPMGAELAHHLFTRLGYGAYFVLVCLVSSDGRLFSKVGLDGLITRTFGLLLALGAVCVGLNLLLPQFGQWPVVGTGGYVGAWGQILLSRELAQAGSLILVGSVFAAGMVLSGDVAVLGSLIGAIVHFLTSPWRFLKHVMNARPRWRSAKPEPSEDTEEEEASVGRKPHDDVDEVEADNNNDDDDEEDDFDDEDDEGDTYPIAFPINAPPKLDPQPMPQPEPRTRPVRPASAKRKSHEDVVRSKTAVKSHSQSLRTSDDEMEFEHEEDMEDRSENHGANAPRSPEKPAPKRSKKASRKAPKQEPIKREPVKVNAPLSQRETEVVEETAGEYAAWESDVELPPLDLLEPPEEFPFEELAEKARKDAVTLEKTFREFGLNVEVVEVDTGPVVTQFELGLEAGLRLNKITSLADDLAIALRVPSIRVVSPIPGKNTVGIEVPNEKRTIVRLRELIESSPKELSSNRIPVFVGKDVSGRPLTVDLTKLPHLLIAGRTGTGKSVCLNALILSMLMTRTPEEVKMLMIDPKMVELSPYRRVPHLMHPVITDMKKAEAVLSWAVDKMEERYDLLARCGVRHLDGYNKLGHEEILNRLGLDPEDPEDMLEAEAVPERMPYIVIIADEMADMIMTCGKDVEGHIVRLAQKSRAVGIHLVLATQKPTVDVITGLIKSNLPARMSFQVASRTDSRVVLDEMGAERLLGNGDMLYLAPGTSHVLRAQGAFVSDEEVNEVIDYYSAYEPQYSSELTRLNAPRPQAGGSDGNSDGNQDEEERDELYEEAVEIVIREQLGSVSRLQRFLGIGYGRAARLIDYMAEDGIVGDYNGSKARQVLYTPEEWNAVRV